MRPTCAHAHLGRDTPVGSRRRGHDNGCAAGNLGGDGHHERTARQNRRASGHVDADSANGTRHAAAHHARHRLDTQIAAQLRLVERSNVCVCDVERVRHVLWQRGIRQVLDPHAHRVEVHLVELRRELLDSGIAALAHGVANGRHRSEDGREVDARPSQHRLVLRLAQRVGVVDLEATADRRGHGHDSDGRAARGGGEQRGA
mmetsp:Transcript_21368/g.64075  ORF Transcript_21368/g.64075 Transcript_21368/m.64075 type:complete len:202 (-) Transcript_21368:54-659(-)